MNTYERALALSPRLAWYTGWLAVPVGVLHSLARYATDAGQAEATPAISGWSEPARDLVGPLVTFAGPDTVYVVYGMLFALTLLPALGCAVVASRRRAGLASQTRGERGAWRTYLAGFSLLAAGAVVAYFGAWLNRALVDVGFAALVVPGSLVLLVGGTWLGVTLLRRGYRPRITPIMLVLLVPAFLGISELMSLGNTFVPMLVGWGFTGRRLSRTGALSDDDGTTGTPGRHVSNASASTDPSGAGVGTP